MSLRSDAFSGERLARMADVMRGYVDRGEVAGVVTLLCRRDEVHAEASEEQKAASPFAPGFWDSHGWGFGLSVIPRRDGVGPSSGSFGWDGGFHTSCYVDPQEDMIGILLAQRLMTSPSPSSFYTDFWTLAYQAIDE